MSTRTTSSPPLMSGFAACVVCAVVLALLGGQATATRKQSNDQERYLATSSAQGSFSLAAGRTTTSPESANTRAIIATGAGFRGMKFQFFGSGADNSTFDYRVWIIGRGLGSGRQWNPSGSLGDWSLTYYGGGTATLSTATGAAASGTPILSSERIADTVTWTIGTTSTTPKGVAGLIEASNGLGVSWVYSPADNTPAWLSIPDFDGAWGVLVEFDLTGATAANCVVEPTP